MKKYWQLFITFARIGLFTIGGGYAMLPMMQSELVERHGWATEQEMMDYYALAQCTPGAIAVNVSTFIGYKIAGVLGGVIATLGPGVPFPGHHHRHRGGAGQCFRAACRQKRLCRDPWGGGGTDDQFRH